MTYDAHRTRVFFDTFGRREWDRLELTVQGRVKYAVHKRLLEEYITPGMRVLDIGSGPGRFAIDIVNLGARVTVADLSPVQLNLAREHMRDLQHGVDGFHVLDATDLSSVPSAEFDAVVCYGGVLSYTRERHPIALRELHRVTRPGGVVLASVMDVFGPRTCSRRWPIISTSTHCRQVSSTPCSVRPRCTSPSFYSPPMVYARRCMTRVWT
jgi:ubiquinone/menaquinone biosynthesis C-methylase UbiE